MVQDSNVGTISDYAEHIKQRSINSKSREQLRASLWRMLLSADRHIARFDMALKRYSRAGSIKDTRSMFVERENMLASLYETLDTVFTAIRMLDFNMLEIKTTLDGVGMSGDDAGFVHEVVDRLEKLCEEIKSREKNNNLKLDFSKPVDEREGVTYTKNPHWCNFIQGDIEKSFFVYFEKTQKELASYLSQIPKIWRQRRLQHFFMKRPALGSYLKLIMTATLGEKKHTSNKKLGLSKRIEKHTTSFVKKQWHIAKDKLSRKENKTLR